MAMKRAEAAFSEDAARTNNLHALDDELFGNDSD